MDNLVVGIVLVAGIVCAGSIIYWAMTHNRDKFKTK